MRVREGAYPSVGLKARPLPGLPSLCGSGLPATSSAAKVPGLYLSGGAVARHGAPEPPDVCLSTLGHVLFLQLPPGAAGLHAVPESPEVGPSSTSLVRVGAYPVVGGPGYGRLLVMFDGGGCLEVA